MSELKTSEYQGECPECGEDLVSNGNAYVYIIYCSSSECNYDEGSQEWDY
jgi:ssDNA-binding Zn-finger/Zn-ribbon topoisomerase 1